jgi:hypothetical protein
MRLLKGPLRLIHASFILDPSGAVLLISRTELMRPTPTSLWRDRRFRIISNLFQIPRVEPIWTWTSTGTQKSKD